MVERGSYEGQYRGGWRTKGGLETPLVGRFFGENKRLTFAPPVWYDLLVAACVLGGLLFLLVSLPTDDRVAIFVGLSVMIAGLWAALSNERMACDLRARTYARLEGQGFRKRVTRGGLGELHALVLMSQEYGVPTPLGRQVIYRLVLYWKHSKEPLLIVARDARTLPIGPPINAAAGPIAHYGQRYAAALGVPFYDNSATNSAGPLAIV